MCFPVGDLDLVSPQRAAGAVVQRDALVLQQRGELLDADAQQFAQESRVAAEVHVVAAVDDAGEIGRDQVPATLNEVDQPPG